MPRLESCFRTTDAQTHIKVKEGVLADAALTFLTEGKINYRSEADEHDETQKPRKHTA